MESYSKPLVRCRVLYLGSVPVKGDITGFDCLQTPLSQRYKETDSEGVDSRLMVYDTGIEIQFVQNPRQVVWFPISTLHICAATKCVNYIDGASGTNSRKFLPIDIITPELSDCSPPVFGFITKAHNTMVCHAFVCKSDQAGMMLVQCCTSAYENRDTAKDVVLKDSVHTIPESGGFIGNSYRFASPYAITSPNKPKPETIRQLPKPEVQHDWEVKPSEDAIPKGMKVVYVPQSVVNKGGDALANYLGTQTRSMKERSPSPVSDTGLYNTISHVPRRDVSNERENMKRERRSHSPPPDYDDMSPRSNSIADCPLCSPRSRSSVDTENCSICRGTSPPKPKHQATDNDIRLNERVKTNPMAAYMNEPGLPPVDYDMDNDVIGRSPPLPKLNDVMRRRAESFVNDSVKDQIILRENRGRRADNLGGRLSYSHQNHSEQAFRRSIDEEGRSGRMVVGHGPSNVYELNGVVGDRLFDDLQDTLGYYP